MKTNTISKEMREVNVLRYGATKIYVDNGETLRMQVKIQLDDECKNGVYSWSVTADIYIKNVAEVIIILRAVVAMKKY
ncbi:hypothetical protein [Paraprevotella clara]|jgi:hypothetical protein|uniref:hypothetical protein n=1 Tax=Paraprevotella clara TaxID=454154 RepID=UPI00206FD4D5|nr:MAG TPA: hypothetical protein [Caudoviricetes sp.]